MPRDAAKTAKRANIAFYVGPRDSVARQLLPDGCSIELFTPTIGRLHDPGDPSAAPWLMYLVWFLTSQERYRIVYIREAGRIVHASHVLSRNPRLAFMDCADLQIGPCHTAAGHRGQGLFPAALAWIVARFPEKRIWTFADRDNRASRRGMAKAGFRPAGRGGKVWGCYRISSYHAS